MKPLFVDTETLGLNGPIVLVQYAEGSGEIVLVDLWRKPLCEAQALMEWITCYPGGIVGFNLAFDCFQITKMWNLLEELIKVYGPNDTLANLIEGNEQEFLDSEERGLDGKCLKPKHILDLMLHAQKGEYQKCLGNDDAKGGGRKQDIRIRLVPNVVAYSLCELLERELYIPDIMYKGKKGTDGKRWKIFPSKDHKTKREIPGFSDVVSIMIPSSSLKNIVIDVEIVKEAKKFEDVGIPKGLVPIEITFAPYGNALRRVQEDQWHTLINNWKKTQGVAHVKKLDLPYKGTWVDFAKQHVEFWEENGAARKYASDDIVYTRGLYNHFSCPAMDDVDSVLSACVSNVRFRGYRIDRDRIEELRYGAIEKIKQYPDHAKPARCAAYIHATMTPEQRVTAPKGTDKITLEKLVSLGGEAGRRASLISEVRKIDKEKQLLDKLSIAGRFFASFRVIGTKSTRMSGSDGLNAQGIKKVEYIRGLFPLAFENEILCGGDFDAFEVGIFQAVSGDKKLEEQIKSGKKIHGLFGALAYGMTYDEVLATDGTADNKYTKAKSGIFLIFYGGQGKKLGETLGIPEEDAVAAIEKLKATYPGIGKALDSYKEDYSSLVQTDGGSIRFSPCKDCVESLYGFKRYFDIEISLIDQLYKIANRVGFELHDKRHDMVVRKEHKGFQSPSGAACSALYGTAFSIQNSMQRQAGNHKIQSTGAGAMKELQCAIWDMQPHGVSDWVVRPMQVHDEIMCVTKKEFTAELDSIVNKTIENIGHTIPLVGMKWSTNMGSWAEK